MKLLKVGADPELFVADDTGIIPGVGLIGGSKAHPMPVEKGALQEDNVLAEFNIEPAASADEFVDNINHVIDQLAYRIAPVKLRVISSHRFDKAVLEKAGPQAMEFGCDPDFNTWTTERNNPPNPASNLRTAGGHVHVSFDIGDDHMLPFKVGAMMDYYLGVPSVILDKDQDRRRMYGAAGSIRPKEYGVEYRTLSNFWLGSDKLMRWVFNNAKTAVENVEQVMELRKKLPAIEVQRIINTGDVKRAKQVINDFGIAMPA